MDSLLENAPCGYLIFSEEGIIIDANQTLLRLLELTHEQIVGKQIDILLTISSRIFYNTHFFPLLKLHGKAEEIFFQLKTSSNETLPALISAERRLSKGENVNHCVILPVHQRKKFEEEILKARHDAENALAENRHLQELKASLEKSTLELDTNLQRQQSLNRSFLQFGKVISHDLQEPIHKINIFTDRLLRQETVSQRGKRDLEKIGVAGERLRILTRALEDFISVDSEKDFHPVNLSEILAIAEKKAAKNNPSAAYELKSSELPLTHGNTNQLTLLFFHLLDNAMQFRDPSRKLLIEITGITVDENLYLLSPNHYKYSEHIRISLKDNGIGFDMQYADYVFEILKKISPNSNRLGIGLGLVKKIVDNHAGTIKVSSVENEGTTFTITLPRA
jgi:phosphoserine phosphatase RsbU/P